MTAATATADAALAAAVDWAVRLGSGGGAEPSHREAFERWLAASQAHRAAWQRVQQLDGLLAAPLAQIRSAQAQQPGHLAASLQALAAPDRSRRRALGGGGAALAVVFVGGWLLNRHTPLATLAADLRTSTGERRSVALPDGSELLLDARSAVDLRFSAQERLVHLREGQLLVRVAPDAARRPFAVLTAEGRAEALGTRFVVRQDAGLSTVSVLEHSVRLRPASGAAQLLTEGASAAFTTTQVRPLDARAAAARTAWAEGLLDARDLPLAEVVDALRPYSPGLLRIAPRAGQLRVFGVFPLDKPAQVLQDLVDTQPIRVRRWGPLLTLIEHADGES